MPYIDSFNVGNVAYDIRDKYAGLYSANAYSSSATYAVDDLVNYDGKLYKCNTAIATPEAWTPAHWTLTTMAAETKIINTTVNRLDNGVQITPSISGGSYINLNRNYKHHRIAVDYTSETGERNCFFVFYVDPNTQTLFRLPAINFDRHVRSIYKIDKIGNMWAVEINIFYTDYSSNYQESQYKITNLTMLLNDIYRLGFTNTAPGSDTLYYDAY